MSLLTTSQRIASALDEANTQILSYLQTQAREVHRLGNTPGLEQEIMDALGTKAVAALTAYGVASAATTLLDALNQGHTQEVLAILQSVIPQLASLGIAPSVPPLDLSRHQPRPDGTVYVAPAPDPET